MAEEKALQEKKLKEDALRGLFILLFFYSFIFQQRRKWNQN